MRKASIFFFASSVLGGALAAAYGCSTSSSNNGSSSAHTPSDSDPIAPPGSSADAGTQAAPLPPDNTGQYSAFPADPVVDPTVGPGAGMAAPPNSAQLFGSSSTGASSGGPCMTEPEPGTLYPRNWLRPRFSWVADAEQNLFELRVHVDNQANDLVVYTTATNWTMPKAYWDALRDHSWDRPISISVRAGTLASGALSGIAKGIGGDVRIAPVEAPGSVVYWVINPLSDPTSAVNRGSLRGFTVGEESVGNALLPRDIQQQSRVTCIGCHTAAPDGRYLAVASDTAGDRGGYGLFMVGVEPNASYGAPPPFVSNAAKSLLRETARGISSFSPAHWRDGDRKLLTSARGLGAELIAIDLQAADTTAAVSTLARTGDSHPHAIAPTWSHDGNWIVYVSGTNSIDGRPGVGANDLYVVRYNGGRGGAAAPLSGAADPSKGEYYPTFSPDDRWIAFNRMPENGDPYSADTAELFVIPGTGGTPQYLRANTPPTCSGKTSPGVRNSWPKWSPWAITILGRTYYWLVFSSIRAGGYPQLYIAPMVVEGNGTVTTYSALYLWNQPARESNHTPAWDVFRLAPSPAEPPPLDR